MHSPNPHATVWLVSYADDDDREMTADEIAAALAKGEIVLTTIVWRDGMPDWKAIVEVPELRAVVQRQRSTRERSTVMGGFGSPAPPPAAPRPPALTPRPPPAAPAPAPPTPEPPRAQRPASALGVSPIGSPRGSLAGGLAAPRVAPPSPPLRHDEPPPGVLSLADDEDPDTRPRGYEPTRTTLTGPGAPELDRDPESEPISLAPESLPPESLESSELESVDELSVPRPPQIFDIGPIDTKGALKPSEVDTVPPLRRSRAGDAPREPLPVIEAPPARTAPPMQSRVPAVSRGPAAPHPPRPSPLPQTTDPLAEASESVEGGRKKGGVAGKLLIAAFLVAATAGAFLLGRRSAPVDGPPTVVSVPVPEATVTVVVTQEVPPAEPPATTESEEAPEEPEAQAAERAAKPARPSPDPGRASSRSVGNTELSREPSAADLPAEPKPVSPAPARDTEPEAPAEAAGPFDKDAAAAALSRAASAAGACRSSEDPSGVAQVSVTFSPTGRATRAIVDGPPFAGTSTGGCIASKMTQAKIPPFTGSRVTVKKRVVIQ